jgi:hypothetical protein
LLQAVVAAGQWAVVAQAVIEQQLDLLLLLVLQLQLPLAAAALAA